jgi:Mrp family chromosome partitioning ATPase
MSKINQAFIKAYRKDEAQATPASPAMANPARASVAAVRPAMAPAASADTAERSAIYGPRPADAPVVRGSPDPALDQNKHRHVLGRPAVEGVARSGDRPQLGSEKRPLSSYIASTGIARLSTEPAEGDFFRPGTTVASFQWPTVCRTLSRQCRADFARVTDLLASHAVAGRSLIGVIGMKRFEGATTVALCIAQRLADRRDRAILVDANFRHPEIASLLETEPTAGWQEVLTRGAPLTEAAIRATDDGLDLLALGGRMPSDLLRAVSGLQAVVTAGVLRHAYDQVIFDLGAYLDAASQPVVLELLRNLGIDAVVAVTRSSSESHRDIGTLADQLGKTGCEFLGIIENLHR